MSCSLEPAKAGSVYRVGRAPDPFDWPDWAYAGDDGTFGGRFDDPEASYRVLYASSQRLGAFVEKLAPLRPDLEVVAGLREIEAQEGETGVAPGSLPGRWVRDRMVGEATLPGTFADIGHGRSLAYLRDEMAARALHYGLDAIDAATIRAQAPRRFTQELSRLVYECTESDGARSFAGVRYMSKLGDEFENWAAFEAVDLEASVVEDIKTTPIEKNDPDLIAAAELLSLTLV